MVEHSIAHPDYERIAAAINWIAAHRQARPTIDDMAQSAGLSRSRFSSLFRAWAGISPQRYLGQLNLADAREALADDATVEEAAWSSGLSGPGRLHDLFVTIDAVTPGEYRRAGVGLRLTYGFAPSPFGDALVVDSDRGVVALRLGSPDDREARLAEIGREWPNATFESMADPAARVSSLLPGGAGAVTVLLPGTPFQHKVWQALLTLEPDETPSYAELARRIGRPGAARAVGQAVGANPVAWLIPCHRVLRADGALGGYRWGTERKRTMLAWEQCQSATQPVAR